MFAIGFALRRIDGDGRRRYIVLLLAAEKKQGQQYRDSYFFNHFHSI
jgi:hypothetical protein